MIQKLEISGVHTDVDKKLREYVTRKIGKLDRFAPRKTRESIHAEIILKDTKAKDKSDKADAKKPEADAVRQDRS